jgi:ATP-dependent DNA helicase RecG
MGSPVSAFRLARLGLCGPLLGGDRCIHGFGGVVALVHRPYTQRGDIFLNLHPDRLEVVNPGPLPLGVTPQNVLHTTVRRNEHLARLFHDLRLMEREGSGFDKIFEVLLSQGRPAPELIETHDRVQVTVRRRILKPEVIDFIAKADETYQLTQRERIALGLLAQHDALTARELASKLELPSVEELQPWLKRLLDWHLVQSAGRTQATRYFVDPGLLRSLKFSGETTLKRIEPHRVAGAKPAAPARAAVEQPAHGVLS